MLTIKLTADQLNELAYTLSEECQEFKPTTRNGQLMHALLMEVYIKLRARTAFPKVENKFTLSAAQCLGMHLYFTLYCGKAVSTLSNNLVQQIVARIDQKTSLPSTKFNKQIENGKKKI